MYNLPNIRKDLLAAAITAAAVALYYTFWSSDALIIDQGDEDSDATSETSIEDQDITSRIIFRIGHDRVEGTLVPSDSLDEATCITMITLPIGDDLSILSFAVLWEDEPRVPNTIAGPASLAEGYEELSIPSSSDLSIGESLSSEYIQDEETIIFEDQGASERILRFNDADVVIQVTQEGFALLLEALNLIHVQLLAPTHDEEEEEGGYDNNNDDDVIDDGDDDDIFDDEDTSTRCSHVAQ